MKKILAYLGTMFSSKQVNRVLIAMLLIVGSMSCQLPVQPTDVTIGVPTTVRILDQGNKLVSGASVDWKIVAPGASTTSGQSTAMTETSDHGIFTAVIPLNITNDTSHVIFHVHAPGSPQYCYTPADSSYTEIGYCGNKVFTYHVDTCSSKITVCDSTSIGSAVNLLASLPTRTSDTAYTNTFQNNLGKDLVITPVSSPVLPASITLWYSIDGRLPWIPYPPPPAPTVKQGSSIRFRFILTDSTAKQSNESVFKVIFSGVDGQNDTCLRNIVSLDAKIQVQTLCDCPTGQFTYSSSAFACLNQRVFDTIDLSSIHNTNTKCNLEFSLSAQTTDNDVQISSSSVPGTIGPGNTLSKFIFEFNPKSLKTYNVEYDYQVTRIAPDGTRTPCDSILKIKFKGVSDAPSCAIDMTSPVLSQAADTLHQKLNLSIDPQGYACLRVINKSAACDLTVGLNDFDPLPSPFHFTNLPLTIPPSDTGCVTIAFLPTDNDVWPNGKGNCTIPINAITTFSAQLKLNNSCPVSHQIFGVVEPPPENKGLLVKFLPPKGQGLNLGVTKGTVQSSTDIIDSLSIWVEDITYDKANPNAATAKLSTGNASNNIQYINYYRPTGILPPAIGSGNIGDISPKNISDYYQTYSGFCGCLPSDTTITVKQYDVIVLNYKNKFTNGSACAVMYIYYIGPPKGLGNGELEIDWQICFPL